MLRKTVRTAILIPMPTKKLHGFSAILILVLIGAIIFGLGGYFLLSGKFNKQTSTKTEFTNTQTKTPDAAPNKEWVPPEPVQVSENINNKLVFTSKKYGIKFEIPKGFKAEEWDAGHIYVFPIDSSKQDQFKLIINPVEKKHYRIKNRLKFRNVWSS